MTIPTELIPDNDNKSLIKLVVAQRNHRRRRYKKQHLQRHRRR